jgi:hypothetical protein
MAVLVPLAGCEVPEAPSWDVDLTVPITSEVYALADLVDADGQFGIDSLGTLTLAVDRGIERVQVDDAIRLEPFEGTADIDLGPVAITAPAALAHALRFVELWPDASRWDGSYHQIEPFDFTVAATLPPFDSLTHATFERARCRVSLTNGLPVALESTTLTLVDPSSGDVIGVAAFQTTVPPGATVAAAVTLDGARVGQRLGVEAAGRSAGSAEPVLIDAGDPLTVGFELLPGATVRSALAVLAPQRIVREQAIELDGGTEAGTVLFADGRLEVRVENRTAPPATVDIILPELRGAGGDTLRASVVLDAGEAGSVTFDLAGATFEPLTAGAVRVRSRMHLGSGGAPIDVQADDTLLATAVLADPAGVERFTGVLEPTEMAIAPTIIELDLPEGLDAMSFAAASMVIELENGAGLPVDLDVELVGSGSGRREVVVPVEARVAPAGVTTSTTTTIVLDRTNSNLVELVNLLPAQIEMRGVAWLGDGETYGTVARDSGLEGRVALEAPLVVTLGADRLTTDPDALELDAEARRTIREDMSGGMIHAEITNHLPTGATMHLVLSRTVEGAHHPDRSGNLVLSGAVGAPVVGPDGLVEAPRVVELELGLDADDVAFFAGTPLYSAVVIDLDGSGGQVVRVLASDWLRVRAIAIMRTRVDID